MALSFEEKLFHILSRQQIRINEPMKDHTTFRVGGPADYYVRPTVEQVPPVVRLCQETKTPLEIIGNGSNLLVGDRGIRGLVMEMGQLCGNIFVTADKLNAEAGCSLAKAAKQAAKAGLSGLEFAAGIPGTIGGAVLMNAGAYGGEIKDVLISARILELDGQIKNLPAALLQLSYRHSTIMETGGIVLSAEFALKQQTPETILARMEELRKMRIEKQPLEYPSAGSTFKRPDGHYAGKLIMEAELMGFQIGGAQVSEKHGGFIINKENATAAEIYELIEEVQRRVKLHAGVTLEPEVRMLGEF